ncbi:MAG: GNAT family N-acetyltransferase [Candidatus Bathyarchaeia archaeon]
MKAEDFPFAVELANTMNWDMTSEDFRFNRQLEPKGCFTLFSDAERVGVATCISYESLGWFGNLIVKPQARGKGAGTLLVEHAVQYLKSKGAKTVGLYAYPHLLDFYGRLGFKPDVEFTVLRTKTLHFKGKPPARKAEKTDFGAIVQLDDECFGAPRKKLLRQILANQTKICHVLHENNVLSGFVAAEVYEDVAEVGPLVCRRASAERAVTLLESAFAELQGLEAWMCLPTAETALVKSALSAGFREAFRVVRMFLGSAAALDCVYVAESLERG